MNTITINEDGVEVTYKLASFGARLGARLLDTIIIIIPANIIPLIAPWLYWALQHSGENQRTVGQNACGIKLMAIEGGKVSFGRATGRFFANILNVLTIFIGFFLFFMTDKRQCLHDLICSTVVVDIHPLTPSTHE